MKILPSQFSRTVVMLATTALFASIPALRADEPIPDTAQRLDQAAAKDGDVEASAKISEKFAQFAGSTANAQALVTGLRSGSSITLTSTVAGQTVTTVFQPATGKLGYGNAFISLSLAQQVLAKDGITQPTPTQIEAALNGGSVTTSAGATVQLSGVLALRASGEGWGNIAQTLDVKLGHVVGEMHSINAHLDRPEQPEMPGDAEHSAANHPDTTAHTDTGRPDMAGNPHPMNPGEDIRDMGNMIHNHGMGRPGKG